MPLPLMILSLLAAASALGFPEMPPVPDLVEMAENSVHGVLSPPTVEEPKVWLPTIAQINDMTDEERGDRFHWFLFVFVVVFFSVVSAGTIVMVVGAEAKALCNSYHGLGQTAPLSNWAQILLVVLSLVVTISLSFIATLWSLQTGRLSKKLGLDWEVYLLLFCCGCLSLLIQSVVAVAWLKAGARFDTTAFAVASMSILPIASDQFDTLKDIIFGALCFQSEHWAIQSLGVLSWLYLLAFHAWFVFGGVRVGSRGWSRAPGVNCFSELATSHLAVLLTAPKVDGESSPGFWEGTILPTLYKQLTPSKRDYLLIENLPQAVLSLLFLFFEGGSMFIVVLNLAVPAVQVGLTFLLFEPVRAASAPGLGKALSRAVASGNTIRAKNIWEEAEVGRDIQLFKRMLPHLRFLLDCMERCGFKEPDKLSDEELQFLQCIARMSQAECKLLGEKIGNSGAKAAAEALKHTVTEVLWLGGNEIGDDGAQAPLCRESPGESGRDGDKIPPKP
eukprot:s4924_g1.t1